MESKSWFIPSPINQVPYQVLKYCPANITPIFNSCWSDGKTSQQWKHAGCDQAHPEGHSKGYPSSPILLPTNCTYVMCREDLQQHFEATSHAFHDRQWLPGHNNTEGFVEGFPGCTKHQFGKQSWMHVEVKRTLLFACRPSYCLWLDTP